MGSFNRKEHLRLWHQNNKEKTKANDAKWRDNNYLKHVLMRSKQRANRRGIEFSITENDIILPTHCPVFGVELKYSSGKTEFSASLDRIDSSKGYIAGNVMVICWRANRLKNDATPEDIEKLYNFYVQTGNKGKDDE